MSRLASVIVKNMKGEIFMAHKWS